MKKTILYSFLLLAILSACNRNKKAITRFDTPTSGEAMIVCDDCFAPIIQEEIAVFTGLNPSAHITPVFTSEHEAFKLLTTDSIRLAIVSRELTEQEKSCLKKFKRVPRTQQIAIDGIALIIHKENTDSLLSISALQKIMAGEIQYWNEISPHKKETLQPITVVFDHQNSSTLRFIKDSICLNQPIGKKLNATSSNQAVIDYVSKHPHALGVIGVNWISNPDDSTKLSFNNTIRVMSVSRSRYPTSDNSYKPFPAYLATGDYPLVRNIYAIISDVRGGLPAGFVSFIAGDSGQRIILKAGLVPATRPTRLINIQTDFNE